jgi:hypothetical protein
MSFYYVNEQKWSSYEVDVRGIKASGIIDTPTCWYSSTLEEIVHHRYSNLLIQFYSRRNRTPPILQPADTVLLSKKSSTSHSFKIQTN